MPEPWTTCTPPLATTSRTCPPWILSTLFHTNTSRTHSVSSSSIPLGRNFDILGTHLTPPSSTATAPMGFSFWHIIGYIVYLGFLNSVCHISLWIPLRSLSNLLLGGNWVIFQVDISPIWARTMVHMHSSFAYNINSMLSLGSVYSVGQR